LLFALSQPFPEGEGHALKIVILGLKMIGYKWFKVWNFICIFIYIDKHFRYMKVITKRLLFIIGGLLLAGGISGLSWQEYKYKAVKATLGTTLGHRRDSHHSIQ